MRLVAVLVIVITAAVSSEAHTGISSRVVPFGGLVDERKSDILDTTVAVVRKSVVDVSVLALYI